MFERVETPRLILRKPMMADAESIFARYASDPEVTRLLAWPTHTSLDATREFLHSSETEWARSPAGAYLIESRENGTLLGGTGLHFEARDRAITGYVLAKDAWGRGYATESVRAIVEIGRKLGLARLYALCHPENAASLRVLAKCGFLCEGILPHHSKFPNTHGDELCDVFSYALRFE